MSHDIDITKLITTLNNIAQSTSRNNSVKKTASIKMYLLPKAGLIAYMLNLEKVGKCPITKLHIIGIVWNRIQEIWAKYPK